MMSLHPRAMCSCVLAAEITHLHQAVLHTRRAAGPALAVATNRSRASFAYVFQSKPPSVCIGTLPACATSARIVPWVGRSGLLFLVDEGRHATMADVTPPVTIVG